MIPYIKEEIVVKKGSACGMTEQAIYSFHLKGPKRDDSGLQVAGLIGNVLDYRRKPLTGLLIRMSSYSALALALRYWKSP